MHRCPTLYASKPTTGLYIQESALHSKNCIMSPAEPDQDFFKSIQWCKEVLDDPDFVIVPTHARRYKEKTTENALFARTLKTAETINACLSMKRRPAQGSLRVDEVRTLLSLGSGLNGNPKVCHGGIAATIMDEVMAVLLTVNKDIENAPVRGATVTAFLHVTYLKAVTTPQVVLVTAKFQETKGRKYFIESAVMNGEKDVLAKANALFVKLNGPKEKL